MSNYGVFFAVKSVKGNYTELQNFKILKSQNTEIQKPGKPKFGFQKCAKQIQQRKFARAFLEMLFKYFHVIEHSRKCDIQLKMIIVIV